MPKPCSARPTEPVLNTAYVTEACPPEVNGVAMAVARALRPLRAAGHRVQRVRPRQRGEAALCSADEEHSAGPGAGPTTTAATLLRLA